MKVDNEAILFREVLNDAIQARKALRAMVDAEAAYWAALTSAQGAAEVIKAEKSLRTASAVARFELGRDVFMGYILRVRSDDDHEFKYFSGSGRELGRTPRDAFLFTSRDVAERVLLDVPEMEIITWDQANGTTLPATSDNSSLVDSENSEGFVIHFKEGYFRTLESERMFFEMLRRDTVARYTGELFAKDATRFESEEQAEGAAALYGLKDVEVVR